MRTNHEVLRIMLENINAIPKKSHGLCGLATVHLVDSCVITLSEGRKIYRYIGRNIPEEFKGTKREGWYWWNIGEVEPRKQWLKEHIELTKPKN